MSRYEVRVEFQDGILPEPLYWIIPDDGTDAFLVGEFSELEQLSGLLASVKDGAPVRPIESGDYRISTWIFLTGAEKMKRELYPDTYSEINTLEIVLRYNVTTRGLPDGRIQIRKHELEVALYEESKRRDR